MSQITSMRNIAPSKLTQPLTCLLKVLRILQNKRIFPEQGNTKLMLQDRDNFKGIISQHSCNCIKEERKDNCSNILTSSNYIKQLKQQQHAQVHRNKHYKQRQLYKCYSSSHNSQQGYHCIYIIAVGIISFLLLSAQGTSRI